VGKLRETSQYGSGHRGGSEEAQRRFRRGSKTIKIMKDLEPTTQAHAHLRLTRHTETRQCREKRYVKSPANRNIR